MNVVNLNQWGHFHYELNFLAYGRMPIALLLLQTHFNHNKKKLIQAVLAFLFFIAYIYSYVMYGNMDTHSFFNNLLRIIYILFIFLCLGFFSDRVVTELF